MSEINIRGARTHNLKNIDLTIPRDSLVVITGLSGSGKSSLAFDTLYAEGQRRYVESLSTYARQFLSMMEKPDVDLIEGLSPAIAIEQKSTSHNPRSTVGTITEIYDYLRVLYARVGEPQCPTHGVVLRAQTISQMVDNILNLPIDSKILLLAPVVIERKGEYQQLFQQLQKQGYLRVRIDGEIYELNQVPALDLKKKHTIEVVVDRLKIQANIQQRLADSLDVVLRLSDGLVHIAFADEKKKLLVFSARFACPHCGYSLAELSPRLFSFNNPQGACGTCDGLGSKQFFDLSKILQDNLSLSGGAIRGWDKRNVYYFRLLSSLATHYNFALDVPFKTLSKKIQKIILHGSAGEKINFEYEMERGVIKHKMHSFEGIIPNMERRYLETESSAVREELAKYLTLQTCPECDGSRLRTEARHVFIENKKLPDLVKLPVEQLFDFFNHLNLCGQRGEIVAKLKKELSDRLRFLIDVGLDYLTLERSAETLSGGESQRIRLASQIGSGLVGVLYILDEPSIGLHQRDNERLLKTLEKLRALGNTVLVVEHDEDAIRRADYIIDMGPGAGIHGGHVVACGSLANIMDNPESLTGQYLSGKRGILVPKQRRTAKDNHWLHLINASGHNLKNVTLDIPVGTFTCVTGVSGSGKSTLINDTLYPIAALALNGATILQPAPYEKIEGIDYFDKVIDINQSPIGRTPRSNPATYTGILTPIRDLFAATAEARARGYSAGRFSFNVKGGRCEACEGDGLIKVEMHFIADVYVQCDVCKGKRYNRETLEIYYKNKNIYEILEMNVEEAAVFFHAVPAILRKLETLRSVGLSYIQLGQSATTLSGGEAQRIKLSKELARRDTGKTFYILDEPTTGLHFHDIEQLLGVLHRLVEAGNTVVVIEHNLDVIKTADWIVDLGPEGGHKGGEIIATGTPEQIIQHQHSYTGQFLKPLLHCEKKL